MLERSWKFDSRLEETGRWKRLDAGRNVETDVAIEDDW
jgi:hypothetical protein